MGFPNAELVLELGLNLSSMVENTRRPTKKLLDPSLSLALSSDSGGGGTGTGTGGGGGGSSFSNGSIVIKREREVASEESEKGGVTYFSGEEDEDGSVNIGRKKLRLTKTQSGLLEEAFKLHTTLNPQQKQKLARDLKLRPRQVEVWFQNRRARTKLKQTEVDCEYLKKCCHKLTDENQRLRREVEELKTQRVSPPIYMATLTMCQTCEQIGAANPATTTTTNIPLITVAPKRDFYNRFPSSSTAC